MSLRDRISNQDHETLRLERGEHECYGYGMDPVVCAECGTAIQERGVPRWIARKQQQGLPAKDMTREPVL